MKKLTILVFALFLIVLLPSAFSFTMNAPWACTFSANPVWNGTSAGNLSKYKVFTSAGGSVNRSDYEANMSSDDDYSGLITQLPIQTFSAGQFVEYNVTLNAITDGDTWVTFFIDGFIQNLPSLTIGECFETGEQCLTGTSGGAATNALKAKTEVGNADVGYNIVANNPFTIIVGLNTTGANRGFVCVRDKTTLVTNLTCVYSVPGITLGTRYNITFTSRELDVGTQNIKGVYVGNLSQGCAQATTFPDTTPPNITYYNLTSSDNGCESWNTDKNNACSTSSVVPTIQFNTNENAWCAIGGSSSSTSLNLNYTDIGSSRNCTGAASGEGTSSHLCTLTSQDELVYDTSYLFISCKDSSNNQNKTSTSSALKLSITGLEAAGRNSIGLGIQNALLSGYINYTDQQIYARNLADNQVTGIFDRVASKSNKTWAFNRIGVSDLHVNMFNMTPVLYTLEFANTTSNQITNQVELMINGTK